MDSVFLLPCLSSPSNSISNAGDISVQVFQKEETASAFSKKDIYIVNTMPFNVSVERKYSDFIWLREVLLVRYPGKYVPPIPSKILPQQHSREAYLCNFSTELLKDPLFRTSCYVEAFFTLEAVSAFYRMKKTAKQLKKPNNVGMVLNFRGRIEIDVSDKSNIYENAMEYLTISTDHAKKLKREADFMRNAVKGIIESFNRYSVLLEQLKEIHELFNKKDSYHVVLRQEIRNIQRWTVFESCTVPKIEEHFFHFFDNYAMKCQVLNNLIKDIDSAYKADIKDERKGKTPKHFYGMFNFLCEKEIHRVADFHTKLLFENTQAFVKNFASYTANLLEEN